ncbi:MAG: S41 family peptidase [Candidatus Saccharibacteria bacterium]
MKRIQAKIKAKITKHIVEHSQIKTKLLTPSVFFVSIALALALGYSAGVYHYNVESAIGPVFGAKAHDASIDMSSLQETYNKLAANYDGTLDTNALIQGANRGMVAAAGDAYTTYFSPSEAIDFNNNLSGNIGGGIGAEIGLKNDKVTINRPLKDNPAIKAGLLAEDVILKVNDESIAGWTVDRAVGVIRGDVGTTVKLTIQRGTEVKDYTITRATINNPSVDSSVVDGLGTITISRFDDKTGALAKAAAQDFVKQGVKSVILDLRYNGGGYVSAAVDVAGLWLDNQVIVTERTGTDGSKIVSTSKSGSDAILKGIPTVVLVNGQSASASEIVAGALQDHKAAKLVGEKTFGKGSVQEPMQLSGGAEIKVTVARWYTPNGKNITKEGITPDVTATLTQTDINNSVDPQVDAAKKALGL